MSDVPTDLSTGPNVTVAGLTGPLDDVPILLDRWVSSDAADAESLAAPVGMACAGPVFLDLVREGPHAVIGGTTGSGKSELLRTLVTSLCATHPPEKVTFVLVDYKGGSTFDGCAGLPHVITVVTDLDGTRTSRVLTAVDAELTRRERWLRERGRVDLETAADQADRPPRLVVIIDEFATLARDQPEFLPSLVDVARRGRSLGLHLILATQRPAGAMTDDIRANTDIRIALRMVDPADSTDLIGAPDAARITADQPGRATLRRGGGPIQNFQVAMVSTGPPAEADLDVRWIDGPAPVGPPSEPDHRPGPTQLEQLVESARAAATRSGRSAAVALWPPELPATLTPEELDVEAIAPEGGQLAGNEAEGEDPSDSGLTVGLADDLTATSHRRCRWAPAQGVLALHGTHSSDVRGVTTGVVTAAHRRWGAVHVYGLDGPGEIDPWADADPVAAVVSADDRDGVRRLVARLERVLRRCAGRDSPSTLFVLHDHPAIARALDDLDGLRLLDRIHRLATEGPARGFAVIVTSPRPGALPPTIAGTVDRRLVLHVAQADDYRLVGLRPPPAPLPPGRALDERGTAVQLVRLDPADLASHTTTPPPLRPRPLDELSVVAVCEPQPIDLTRDPWLLPVGVDHDGTATLMLTSGQATVVAGPPGSGRSIAIATIAREARRRGTTVITVADAEPEHLPAHLLQGHLDAGGGEGRVLIVVDDATEVSDETGTLAGLVRGRLRPGGVRLVVAVDPVERRAAYGHWTASLRRCRTGIALHHDPDEDRDLWVSPLPPAPIGQPPPGRGLLLGDVEVPIEIQVARP